MSRFDRGLVLFSENAASYLQRGMKQERSGSELEIGTVNKKQREM